MLFRIKASLPQEELAFRTGLGRTHVGVLERGEKEPCLGVMYPIANALGANLLDICGMAEKLYKDGYKPAPRNARVIGSKLLVTSEASLAKREASRRNSKRPLFWRSRRKRAQWR